MSYILHLDTTTKLCSVALAKNGELIALKEEYDENYSHAEKLNSFIEDVVTEGNVSLNNLSAVAVSKGPGSYTGLRIGVSTAKGLCYGLNIPLLSVETLPCLAYAASRHSAFIPESLMCAMLDARRMEVYSQIFDAQLNSIRDIEAQIISERSFEEYSSNKILHLFGDGAEKCKNILTSPRIRFLPNIQTSAKWMISFAYQKYSAKIFEDVAYFEPFYLKDFIAGGKR